MSEHSAPFLIEDWRVEPTRGRIVHAIRGNVVHVRPKSMAVLEALAAAHGEVVSRDRLMAEVWPGTVVSDESLTRCIADLRQAMGDSGRAPRFVETVPKRGYRLIPEVRRSEVAADSGSGDRVDAGTAVPAPVPPPETTAGNPTAGKRRGRWLWPAAAGLLLLALLVQWQGDDDPADIPVVAILPAAAPAAPTVRNDLLGIAAVDLLFQRLSEIPQIRVRGPASVSGMEDTLGAAAALGADQALEVRTDDALTGDKLQAAVWLHDLSSTPPKATLIGRFDLPVLDSDADIETFLGIRERVAERVVERLLPALDVPPEGAASPRDAEAYRLYLQARDRLGRPGCEGTGPNVLLERSLAQDADYVPAWVALGWANYALASTCGLGPQHYDGAIAAADEALTRAPDSLPAVALKATVQVETGEAREALQMLDRYLERFPGSAALHYAASYAAYYLGELALAERQLGETLALDPLFLTAEGWTPNVLLYQQRYDDFLALLPATRSTLFDFYRGFALFRMGRPDAARPLLAEGYAENPTDVFGRLSGVLLALLDEAPDTAMAILDTLAHERRIHGIADGEVAYRLAQLAALGGDSERAREQLEMAEAMGFRCAACVLGDPLFSTLGAGGESGAVGPGAD